jgi:hypothetical protein
MASASKVARPLCRFRKSIIDGNGVYALYRRDSGVNKG